jgi:hypothetical protein
MKMYGYFREVPGSNLGPETSYPKGVHGFPQRLQANSGIVPKIRPRQLPFTYFHSLIALSFDTI